MEAERDALELLDKAWTGIASARLRLPIDPFAIAREMGIQVFTHRDLPIDVAGMLRKQAGYSDPEILLNALDSRNRQRFTCARELGHYVRRVENGEEDAWEYVDHRDALTSGDLDPDEVYANQFAAGLLMPKQVVKEHVGDSNAAALALDFGVSGDAIGFRLRHLGIN